jgi:hypothetical protein
LLCDLHQQPRPFYSDIGRLSVDPELMIRTRHMLDLRGLG